MMIVGLMVLALICLAVGLFLPSSAWLVASLIATAGAGYLLWKMRSAVVPVHAGAPAGASDPVASDMAETDPADTDAAATQSADADLERDRPQRPVVTDDRTQVFAAVPTESTRREDADSTQVIAAVPAAGDTVGRSAGETPGDVWVIDGRPRFHLGSCPIIQGQDAEAIPFEQATEDGFMPCSLCEPTAPHDALTPRSTEGRIRHSTRR
jgi:hypothetical protein